MPKALWKSKSEKDSHPSQLMEVFYEIFSHPRFEKYPDEDAKDKDWNDKEE